MTLVSGSSMAPICELAESSLDARQTPPPLPRLVYSRNERAAAGGFALLGCLVFVIAAILSPYDAAGRPLSHGTHRQLGLPPCTMKALTGAPCPSCGMTTSISLVMHGDLTAASEANWAGLLVAVIGLIAIVWLAAVAAGFPAGSLTVDETLKWLTVIGSTAALVRWLALVFMWFRQ